MGFSRRTGRRVATGTALAALLAVAGAVTSTPASGADAVQQVPSTVETAPGSHSGDSIDDPSIWVAPDPSRSLVMANDKKGAFETYDLQGHLVQRLTFGDEFWGNSDVRQDVTIAGVTRDLVGVSQSKFRFYSVDPDTRRLSSVTEGGDPIGGYGEGFCLYHSADSGALYAIHINRAGTLREYAIVDTDHDGLLEADLVRQLDVGSEAEGCVADDQTGALYVSEEDVALWRYGAEPGDGTSRVAVDTVDSTGGHQAADIEGVTLVPSPDGGYLIASAQNASSKASYFTVYRRGAGNDYVKSFRVTNGKSSDDCDHTDGVAAVSADLGPTFPAGLFVCQDNNNDAPGSSGNQDLKLVRLDDILGSGSTSPPPPPPPAGSTTVEPVGQDTTDANSTSFAVQVPDAVVAGDVLVLFASRGNAAALDGPGSGWTQVGDETDGSLATTVWTKVAGDDDAGSTVRLGADDYTKAAVTLAAYRGADPADPLAAIAVRTETGTGAAHRTPDADGGSAGAEQVSYWADKGLTSSWSAPAGETVLASAAGTGQGRVSSLLTGSTLSGGTATGETATADAVANKATMWTLVLRPGS